MSDYEILFVKDNITYQLPVNPEQIEITFTQAIEKYEVLKLGQIAVPTHLELKKFSFECELPQGIQHYVETSGNFRDADYYLNLLARWCQEKAPFRFIASNGISEDINNLVLIEELTVTEKAGEEGDKYINVGLLEYRECGKDLLPTTVDETPSSVSPKSSGSYVVNKGDTLWAIAKKYYADGSKYQKIAKANKLKNPALIYPGQKLVIPE